MGVARHHMLAGRQPGQLDVQFLKVVAVILLKCPLFYAR